MIAADEDGLRLALPGLSEKIWHMDAETAMTLFGGNTLPGPATINTLPAQTNDAAKQMLARYMRILISVLNAGNTVQRQGMYDLDLIGWSEDCVVLYSQPSAGDWKTMLEKLYNEALQDEELERLIRQGATASSISGAEPAEDKAAQMLADFREMLTDALNNAENTLRI